MRKNKPFNFLSHSVEETQAFGASFAKELILGNVSGNIIAFFGDLATGKTTLIKGIVAGYTGCSLDEISSPTYSYLHIYGSLAKIYHFDLYRLPDSSEFLSMGFDEFFFKEGICLIEWAEKIEDILSSFSVIRVTLEHVGPESRRINIE